MTSIKPDEPSAGMQRWLAETLRIQESEQGGAIRSNWQAGPEMADLSPEQRILHRALQLNQQQDSLQTLRDWRTRAGLLSALLLALAFLSGFFSALVVLGDGEQTINVIWATGGLLGLHLLTLLLWLFSSISNFAPGGLFGQLWLWLLEHLPSAPERDASLRWRIGRGVASRAALGILNRSRASYWGLSLMTHGLWFAALLGVTIGTLMSLALRSYSFNIETTILPADVFVQTITATGWLPSLLGFGIPDMDAIRDSLIVPEQTDAVRRAWASWLVGVLLVYGVLPRLLLATTCLLVFRQRLLSFRLDLALPAYAALLRTLMPRSQAAGVNDQAPSRLPEARIGQFQGDAVADSAIVLLETDEAEFPAQATAPFFLVETREQRHAALQQLMNAPVSRLLIVCNPRISPDRSALGWIAQASLQARATRILLPASPGLDPERLQSWQLSLTEAGLDPEQMMLESGPAREWITNHAN